MKQKIQDLILLIKANRSYQVLLVIAVMAVGWLVFSEPQARQARQKPKTANNQSLAINRDEAYTDLMSAMKSELTQVREGVDQNTQQIKKITEDQDKDRQRVAEIFKKMLDRLADVQNTSAAGQAGYGGPAVLPDDESGLGGPTDTGAELASFGSNETNIVPPPPPQERKVAVIAPGDSVRIKLLAGVNAPTDGTPYPVVFKLIDDVHGPDSSTLPLGEARIVAAAQGSLSDQRALFRLTTLNIRLPDGRKKILPVDGWVVGEDGIRGMEGILIDPIGKAIAGSAEAGMIAGIGEGFAQSQQTYHQGFFGTGGQAEITGDPLVYAAGKSASGAANALSSIIKDRISLLVPHVKVYSGREATAVFSKPINITDLYEALDNGDNSFANSVD